MRFFTFIAPSLLGALLVSADATTSEPAEKTVEPSLSAIAAAAQTAPALSPVSNVKGAAFDRFLQVWLENTNYDSASGDANQQYARTAFVSYANVARQIFSVQGHHSDQLLGRHTPKRTELLRLGG